MIVQIVTFEPNKTAKRIIKQNKIKSTSLNPFEKLSDLFGYPIDKKASLTSEAHKDRLITQ